MSIIVTMDVTADAKINAIDIVSPKAAFEGADDSDSLGCWLEKVGDKLGESILSMMPMILLVGTLVDSPEGAALGLLDGPLTTHQGFGQKPAYWSTDLSFGVQF